MEMIEKWIVTFKVPDFEPEMIEIDQWDFNCDSPSYEQQQQKVVKIAHEITGEWGEAKPL